MKTRIYGYARVSTMKQSIERQIDNIKKEYPDAIIYKESYTGTKMDRPKWNDLMKKLHKGDTVVFDEVSRMSRDAEEGFRTYQELYNKGVNLVFIKESTLNTDNFRSSADQIAMTGSSVDCILKAINEYLMILAENQIKSAFQTAQHEVDFLHQRTKEGIENARRNGKQIGLVKGTKLTTKKSLDMKKKIKRLSREFDGDMSDKELMDILGLARNTFYKYKRELKSELE